VHEIRIAQPAMSFRRRATGLLLMVAAVLPAANAAVAPAQRPLLLELFTSQGCSSCPPADAVLRELAAQPDLLPLAFHVDYWNDLGWVDPYSAADFSARQQGYADVHGFSVYTPQLVVDGHADVIGSSRGAVQQAIAAARGQTRSATSSIVRSGGEVSLSVGAIPGATISGTVYLLSFDSSDTTRIERGENAGRTLSYVNVVRSLRRVAEWRNQPLSLTERLQPEERGDRLALLVQDRAGTVWALASTPAAGR
jgi:hypothetical protein